MIKKIQLIKLGDRWAVKQIRKERVSGVYFEPNVSYKEIQEYVYYERLSSYVDQWRTSKEPCTYTTKERAKVVYDEAVRRAQHFNPKIEEEIEF